MVGGEERILLPKPQHTTGTMNKFVNSCSMMGDVFIGSRAGGGE